MTIPSEQTILRQIDAFETHILDQESLKATGEDTGEDTPETTPSTTCAGTLLYGAEVPQIGPGLWHRPKS